MSIYTPDACWKVRARDRNVMLSFEQLQVFQQIGDDACSTVGRRVKTRRFSGVDRAASPHKQDSSMCLSDVLTICPTLLYYVVFLTPIPSLQANKELVQPAVQHCEALWLRCPAFLRLHQPSHLSVDLGHTPISSLPQA